MISHVVCKIFDIIEKSLNKSTSLLVSLFVCLLPNSSETANPSNLKFWGMIPLGMQNVLG